MYIFVDIHQNGHLPWNSKVIMYRLGAETYKEVNSTFHIALKKIYNVMYQTVSVFIHGPLQNSKSKIRIK